MKKPDSIHCRGLFQNANAGHNGLRGRRGRASRTITLAGTVTFVGVAAGQGTDPSRRSPGFDRVTFNVAVCAETNCSRSGQLYRLGLDRPSLWCVIDVEIRQSS